MHTLGAAQLRDTTAGIVMGYTVHDTPSSELNEEGSDPRLEIEKA